MNARTWTMLVSAAFVMHGLGMAGAGGYLPWSVRSAKADFIGRSWLLGSGTAAVVAGVIVWAVAGIAFTAAGIGLWQAAPWWRAAAWVGSGATLVAVAAWAGAVPFGVYVGAALAVATIVYLLR